MKMLVCFPGHISLLIKIRFRTECVCEGHFFCRAECDIEANFGNFGLPYMITFCDPDRMGISLSKIINVKLGLICKM